MFNHLFNPLIIDDLTIPNRICFLAHRTNLAKNGRLTDRLSAYYVRRAQGKCGLIILGELSIHPDDRPWEAMIEMFRPEAAEDFLGLTQKIHKTGAKVFAQLNHRGFQSSGAITRKEIWGPSAVADIVYGETAKPMEPEDMDVLIDAYANAGRVAADGGFDGLEIDMGPEAILRQFLSPLSNQRRDEYGGSIENRMRLPLQVLKAVRKKVGEDFIVGIRLCVDEKFWGAITPEESKQFAECFANEGRADFIDVTVGTYYNLHLFMASMHMPFGFALEAAEHVKKAVNIPVIASHQINTPQLAEEILERGQADAIGLIRNLICDPDMPRKALEDRTRDIRYCVRDNKGCIGRVNRSKRIGCIQNPDVGHESNRDAGVPIPAASKKRVMVIGGGPAGLEAARTIRERGHDVSLYEKNERVGGQINLIKMRPRRRSMEAIIIYLKRALKELNVPVITNRNVTVDLVMTEKPDAVVVATGSRPIKRPVPGDYGPPQVLNVWEVITGEYPVGEKILFIDENGGHHAASTVEFLADQGKKVHMVTSDLFVGAELAPLGDLSMTRQRLLQKGVTFETDIAIDEIEKNIVKGRDWYTHKFIIFQDYDTIVLDMGNAALDGLYRALKGKVEELYRIGDCVAPRGIDMAVMEGRRVGERI